MLRWVSADIQLEYDEAVTGTAHLDLGAVYLNSVLTLYGDGTIFWNSNEAARTKTEFDWDRIAEIYPPSGQTRPGEILVLTGHKRASALNRPELATLHAAPDVERDADRVVALFYFDAENPAP